MSEQAPLGVIFDFFLGVRAILPAYDGPRTRKLRIYDGQGIPKDIVFGKERKFITNKVGFFVKYKLELLEDDCVVWTHDFDCRGKNVIVKMEGALGDTLAWLPIVERFSFMHGCRVMVGMHKDYLPLLKGNYPFEECHSSQLHFYDNEELNDKWISNHDIYACYILSYRSENTVCRLREKDTRLISLQEVAQDTLKVPLRVRPGEEKTEVLKPKVTIMAPNKRPMKEKYVTIGADAGGIFKRWNNPTGWADVAKHLKDKGYRTVCIDKKPIWGAFQWPKHIDNQTGNRPLTERARWLAHADLFIGLSSGLSWLAWAVNTPVVLVSGFTLPFMEFETPYRVINSDICHGCWNDPTIPQPHTIDPAWCPRQKGTAREYECSRLITAEQVIATVDKALADRQAKENPA